MSQAEQSQESAEQKHIEIKVYVDRKRELVLARGTFSLLFWEFAEHARRWKMLPDGEDMSLVHQGLAAATLDLACKPPDEFSSWTVNLREPPTNLFFTGDNSDFKITGRIFVQNVETNKHSRIFRESQRPKHQPRRSVVETDSTSVLGMFEDFWFKSDQIPTRFFHFGQDQFGMIQGLPRADRKFVQELSSEEALAIFDEQTELVETRQYAFKCGCDLPKIVSVVQGLYRGKEDSLFQEDEKVEIFCPRCGRLWWVSRDEFHAGHGNVGMA